MEKVSNKIARLLLVIFFFSSFFIRTPNSVDAITFSDLSTSHWAYEAIMEMVDRGIMNGYPDGSFRPNNPVSRAETSVILVKIFKIQPITPKKPSFVDTSTSHWAYSHIEAIHQTRLMSESISYNQFTPDKNLTRISFVPIQVRALGMKYFAENISEQEKAETLQQFMDQSQVPYWARGFLTIAVKANSISGYPDRTFKPRKEVTRAEMAALIYELIRPGREGEGDGFKPVTLLSVSGAPFRALLSRKLSGALFEFSGKTSSQGIVKVVLNNIPFLPVNADKNGFYSIELPIGFIGIGEIDLNVVYSEMNSKNISHSFKAYSSVPFDMFPNYYRLYGFSYSPQTRQLLFSSKSASPVSLELINRTNGEKQNRDIKANENYSLTTILQKGINNISLIIKQSESSWKLTYGIVFTIG